jgi:hypothetical protein
MSMKYSLPSRIITSCQQPGSDHRQQQAHTREMVVMVPNSYPGLRMRAIVIDPPFASFESLLPRTEYSVHWPLRLQGETSGAGVLIRTPQIKRSGGRSTASRSRVRAAALHNAISLDNSGQLLAASLPRCLRHSSHYASSSRWVSLCRSKQQVLLRHQHSNTLRVTAISILSLGSA